MIPASIDPQVCLTLDRFEEYVNQESRWRGKAIIYYDTNTHKLGVTRLSFWQQLKWNMGWKRSILSSDRVYQLDKVMSRLKEQSRHRATLLNPLKGAQLVARRYLAYREHHPRIEDESNFANKILDPTLIESQVKAKDRIINYFEDIIEEFKEDALNRLIKELTIITSQIGRWEELSPEQTQRLKKDIFHQFTFTQYYATDGNRRQIYQSLIRRREEESDEEYRQRWELIATCFPSRLLELHLDGNHPEALAREALHQYEASNSRGSFYAAGRAFGGQFSINFFIEYLKKHPLPSDIEQAIYTVFEREKMGEKDRLDLTIKCFNTMCVLSHSINLLGKSIANENGMHRAYSPIKCDPTWTNDTEQFLIYIL